MIINNITPPQVWSASARSLTNIGSGALAPTSVTHSNLAAASTVDLRPSAGTVGIITIGMATGGGATAAVAVLLYDGSVNFQLAISAAAANANTGFTLVNTSAVGCRGQNGDGAIVATYQTAAWVFTI